jgi:hypothetical protein
MMEEARATVRVPSLKLDDVAQPTKGCKELIWVDVQGYEGYVLAGATQWLAAGVPVCTEFWPYGLKRSGSFDMLKVAVGGYRGFYDLDNVDKLRPIGDLDALYHAVGEDGSWTDVLFVAQ